MAKVVRQAQVLKHIIALLKKEFRCAVYSDEVREKFLKPCFFIAASSVMTPQTVNWMQKELTVVLTYYAKTSEKNEVTYMDVIDRVQLLLQVGLQVDDRHLKIDSVEDDRVGEEDDILQITIVIPYLEQVTGERSHSNDLMEELDMTIAHDGGKDQQETFYETIDKDTI